MFSNWLVVFTWYWQVVGSLQSVQINCDVDKQPGIANLKAMIYTKNINVCVWFNVVKSGMNEYVNGV